LDYSGTYCVACDRGGAAVQSDVLRARACLARAKASKAL
jgi:hypothetical protein